MAAWREERNGKKSPFIDWLPIIVMVAIILAILFFDIHV